MPARYAFVLTCLVITSLDGQARSADEKAIQPTIQVQLRSLGDLLEDLRFLGTSAGEGSLFSQVQRQLERWLPKGFEGVDAKKPIFIYEGIKPANDEIYGVVYIPLSNEAAFVNLIESVGQCKAAKNGIFYSFQFPVLTVPIFMRVKDGYACASQNQSALEDARLLDPKSFWGSEAAPTARLRIRFDRFPNSIKRVVVSEIEAHRKDQEAHNLPGDSDQWSLERSVYRSFLQFGTVVVQEGDELNVEIDFAKQRDKLRLKLGLKAQHGTTLASFVSKLDESDSLFGSWFAGSKPVWQLAFHGKFPVQVREMLQSYFLDDLIAQTEKDAPGWGKNLYELLKPTIEAGDLDVAMRYGEPTSKGFPGMLVGFKVMNADKVEKWLKDLVQAKSNRFKANVARLGSHDIHGIEQNKDAKAAAIRLVGDDKAYVAFRKDAAIVAFGENSLADLDKALSAGPKRAKPVQAEVNLGLVSRGYAKSSPEFQEEIKKQFPRAGDDRATLSLEGGESLRLNVEMAIPLIEMLISNSKQ